MSRRHLIVFLCFAALAYFYVRPLFDHLGTRLAVNAGDPALNAAILWWNATVVPLTDAWWNQPWFHPATGVTALTENLLGLTPIATPIYWLTHDVVTTYNLTFFLSWPLSAFACYLLVRRLTSRIDAGIIAGLAFGFSPYRVSAEIGHLQSLSAYWLPVALLALHAFVDTRRRYWLAMFGIAWVLQSLANGYYMLFGAVLIGLWLAYFGTRPDRRRASLAILGAWTIAGIAVLPIVLGYQHVHDYYGLKRTFAEAQAFSAHPDSFLQISELVRAWQGILSSGKDTLFPGLTVLVLLAAGVVLGLSRRKASTLRSRRQVLLQRSLAVVFVLSLTVVLIWLARGAVSVHAGDWTLFRMTNPSRAVIVMLICGAVLLWMAPVRRAIATRSPFVFYAGCVPLMALLACGPVLSVRDSVLLDPSPYRWLMALPGFDELRVPSRFWMIGVLCLSAAAGLAFNRLVVRRRSARVILCAVVCAGILADGWITAMPAANAAPAWTSLEGSDPSLPLLELPLGPSWDNAATFRVTAHRRPVMNGVSGYDPPFYAPLQAGLATGDRDMLSAIASLGAYEISVEAATDRSGYWKGFVLDTGLGAVRVAGNDERIIFRVPAVTRVEPDVGLSLTLASVRSNAGDAATACDRRMDTDWLVFPQAGVEWLIADLGQEHDIGAVSVAIGRHAEDFPRRLAIDVSADGQQFDPVWEGRTAASSFLASLKSPREAWLRLSIAPHRARYVRIRQTGTAKNAAWRVAELEINAPIVKKHP